VTAYDEHSVGFERIMFYVWGLASILHFGWAVLTESWFDFSLASVCCACSVMLAARCRARVAGRVFPDARMDAFFANIFGLCLLALMGSVLYSVLTDAILLPKP